MSVILILLNLAVPLPSESVRSCLNKPVRFTISDLKIVEAPRTILKPSDGVWRPGEVDPIGTYCNCSMCRRNRMAAKPYLEDTYDPTPINAVEVLLRNVKPTKDDVLYDLGCGDGRIPIAAAKIYGCRSVGIEYNKVRADVAKRNVAINGVSNLVTIYHMDAFRASINKWATIVVLYGDRKFLTSIKHKLESLPVGTEIVSYAHPVPGWDSIPKCIDGYTFYTYKRIERYPKVVEREVRVPGRCGSYHYVSVKENCCSSGMCCIE